MAARYLCWGTFTLTAPWRLPKACWLLDRRELYQCRQIGREGRGGHHFIGFNTHTHATVEQSVGIAPDIWHAANKEDKQRGMRESVRAGRMLECSEWQTTGRWEEASVMECEVEDLRRRWGRPSACQLCTATSHHWLFLFIFYRLVGEVRLAHCHKLNQPSTAVVDMWVWWKHTEPNTHTHTCVGCNLCFRDLTGCRCRSD